MAVATDAFDDKRKGVCLKSLRKGDILYWNILKTEAAVTLLTIEVHVPVVMMALAMIAA